jgi:hypothetical protein
VSEVTIPFVGGHLPFVGALFGSRTIAVSTSSNVRLTPQEIEDALDVVDAQRSLADPAPRIPIEEILARYAEELGDLSDTDW